MHRNCFGRQFDGGGLDKFGGEKGAKYFLGFKVIGMGDVNAVAIAQEMHLAAAPPCDRGQLCYGRDFPTDPLFWGCYIDDTLIVERVRKGDVATTGGALRAAVEKAHAGYASSGLERSPEKSFGMARGPNQRGDTVFTTWGTVFTMCQA